MTSADTQRRPDAGRRPRALQPRALLGVLVAVLLALGAIAPVAASQRVPKVALIVGPVGSITSSYRALANEAARVARDAGAQVVKVYSPNATWPAVKAAITDASIVVYLGHGNGWPSRYRDALYPPSQNGFGLNPVAGDDDSSHQYFGEASVDNVRLADNAVVLLHHLCYASGNTEPGLAEGSLDVATQRVDNYAAGFIRAGAKAVVAEAHMGPAWYVRQLLTTNASITSIWNRSPEAKGHTMRFASVRSPGFTSRLDPDTKTSGFYRSLVARGVTASDLRSGAVGSVSSAVLGPPPVPTLANAALKFGTLTLGTLPIASTKTKLSLSLTGGSVAAVPKGAQVGLRWDPVLLDPPLETAPTGSAQPAVTATPEASVADPQSSPTTMPRSTPAGATPSPTPPGGDRQVVDSPELVVPAEPPAVDLVVAEQIGKIVDLVPVKRHGKGLSVETAFPDAAGLYRLVPTLHTPTGEAYDAATQDLLVPVLVRVAGSVAVAYGAPPSLRIVAGMPAEVQVRVLDVGAQPWEEEVVGLVNRWPAHLVAMWAATTDVPLPPPASALLSPEEVQTPNGEVVSLALDTPAVPGEYLLVIDVVSPVHGPLSALGSAPAIVRVTVTAGAAPQATTPPGPEAADGH